MGRLNLEDEKKYYCRIQERRNVYDYVHMTKTNDPLLVNVTYTKVATDENGRKYNKTMQALMPLLYMEHELKAEVLKVEVI